MLEVIAAATGPERRPAQTDAATPLFDGGYWLTSVDMLEIVLACEAEFDVTFDEGADLAPGTLRTVGDLVALVERKRAG